jgi:hypothetical protein
MEVSGMMTGTENWGGEGEQWRSGSYKQITSYEMFGLSSHCGDYEEHGLLSCNKVQ